MTTTPLNLDAEQLANQLTGRGDGLRKSKPRNANGLLQYIWRHCRLHAGHDTSMPVTASWWLQDYLDQNNIDASVTGILDDQGKAITQQIDDLLDDILRHLNENPHRGAARWKQTGAF